MLEFPVRFVSDDRANEICERKINERLKGLLRAEKDTYESDTDGYASFDDFIMEFELLPADYERAKASSVYDSLMVLLESKEKKVPYISQEYMLAHVIEGYMDTCMVDDEPEYDLAKQVNKDLYDEKYIAAATEKGWYMPNLWIHGRAVDYLADGDREYVLSKMSEDMADHIETEAGIPMRLPHCLEIVEDIRDYLEESCFWDCDYEMLDSFTEDQLANMGANAMLGIGAEADDENEMTNDIQS